MLHHPPRAAQKAMAMVKTSNKGCVQPLGICQVESQVGKPTRQKMAQAYKKQERMIMSSEAAMSAKCTVIYRKRWAVALLGVFAIRFHIRISLII
jgi:hypothetical protein